MNLSTQITCPHLLDPAPFGLKKRLQALGITVAHPYGSVPDKGSPWLSCELILDRYECIERSDFHIVYNDDGLIEEDMVLEVEFAMLMRKPIIMLRVPNFKKTAGILHSSIVTEKMDKLVLCDLTMLDDEDLRHFFERSPLHSVNYHLSNDQIKNVTQALKVYFGGLCVKELIKEAV